eukprot:m.132020 g.132020  ORF g.132020 m.132020 type:complete len:98 (+) comp29580_c0_seq3:44-337(+)
MATMRDDPEVDEFHDVDDVTIADGDAVNDKGWGIRSFLNEFSQPSLSLSLSSFDLGSIDLVVVDRTGRSKLCIGQMMAVCVGLFGFLQVLIVLIIFI